MRANVSLGVVAAIQAIAAVGGVVSEVEKQAQMVMDAVGAYTAAELAAANAVHTRDVHRHLDKMLTDRSVHLLHDALADGK